MADSKITGLTATTAPVGTDIAPIVVDPSGTPLNRKVTLANLITKAHGVSDGIVKIASSVMGVASAGTDYYNPGGTDVAVADGGTGKSAWTQYLIPYADTTTSLSQISIGTAGQPLLSGGAGVAPAFGSDLATAVTIGTAYIYRVGGTDISVADGGTGKSAWTQYLIPYADTTTSFSQIAIGTAGQPLLSGGAGVAPSFGSDLATATTIGTAYIYRAAGTDIPPADGGTGVSNGSNNTITFTGNYTLGLTLTNNTSVTLPVSGTLLANVVEDSTPQLAATLDCQEYDIDNVGDIIHDDATASDWTFKNQDSDKDIIFNGNDGGADTVIMKLDVSEGQLSGIIKATAGVLGAATSGTDYLSISSPRVENAQTGTTYTLAIADAGKIVTLTNGAAITVTVPLSASVAIPVGTQIECVQGGAGKVTFAAEGGVTINSEGGNLAIAAQTVPVTLWKQATNTWYLFGKLIA